MREREREREKVGRWGLRGDREGRDRQRQTETETHGQITSVHLTRLLQLKRAEHSGDSVKQANTEADADRQEGRQTGADLSLIHI